MKIFNFCFFYFLLFFPINFLFLNSAAFAYEKFSDQFPNEVSTFDKEELNLNLELDLGLISPSTESFRFKSIF